MCSYPCQSRSIGVSETLPPPPPPCDGLDTRGREGEPPTAHVTPNGPQQMHAVPVICTNAPLHSPQVFSTFQAQPCPAWSGSGDWGGLGWGQRRRGAVLDAGKRHGQMALPGPKGPEKWHADPLLQGSPLPHEAMLRNPCPIPLPLTCSDHLQPSPTCPGLQPSEPHVCPHAPTLQLSAAHILCNQFSATRPHPLQPSSSSANAVPLSSACCTTSASSQPSPAPPPPHFSPLPLPALQFFENGWTMERLQKGVELAVLHPPVPCDVIAGL